MEHTNLFLYENDSALQADYPNGKVDTPTPGVAYARATGSVNPTVIYNKKKTTYTVTLNLKNRSGATIGGSSTVQTPEAIEGDVIKVNIVAPEVVNYKPSILVEKIEVSANTSHDVVYNSLTSYTVTVHHMCEGSAITADTTVVSESVYETEKTSVTIEPVEVTGYTAKPVTITISGDCEYELEYSEYSCEAVDLGLPSGTLWLSCNVGASAPEDYGDFYAWGELETKSKSQFTEANYKFYNGSSGDYTKYNDDDGIRTLDLADDVANAVMGGDWHIPSSNQVYELMDYTTSAVTSVNGVSGIRLTSTENGNSLFFPFAGIAGEEIPSGYEVFGIWTNTLGSSGPFVDGPEVSSPQLLGATSSYDPKTVHGFNNGTLSRLFDSSRPRWSGLSVRPVLGEYNPGPILSDS